MIGASPTWTTERIALLKDRIDAGLSCGQIAREIGVSRNAVIGKAHRLGLSRFKGATAGHRERTDARNVARSRVAAYTRTLLALWAKPPLAFAQAPEDSANLCPLFELQQWHCRWPIGDPSRRKFRLLRNKQVDSLPYCAAHARMAYRRDRAARRTVQIKSRAAELLLSSVADQIAALKPEAQTAAVSPRMTGASAQEEIDEPGGEFSASPKRGRQRACRGFLRVTFRDQQDCDEEQPPRQWSSCRVGSDERSVEARCQSLGPPQGVDKQTSMLLTRSPYSPHCMDPHHAGPIPHHRPRER